MPKIARAGMAALVVFAVLVGAGYLLVALDRGSRTSSPAGQPPVPGGPPGAGPTDANPIVAENQRPGTTDWRIQNVAASKGIEGYADHASARRGDSVVLFVSTSAARFSVQAYRMGYYGGLGGRLVWRSPPTAGAQQAAPAVQPGTNMVSASWRSSLTIHIDGAWPPGDYLLKLVGEGGEQRYVPLTVVDESSTAALVVLSAVTTWQAYNNWGGYNLYNGPDGTFATRSRVL